MHKHHGTRHRIRCGRRDLNGSLNRERVFNRVHDIFPYVMRRLIWIIFASRKLENVAPSWNRIVPISIHIYIFHRDEGIEGLKVSKRFEKRSTISFDLKIFHYHQRINKTLLLLPASSSTVVNPSSKSIRSLSANIHPEFRPEWNFNLSRERPNRQSQAPDTTLPRRLEGGGHSHVHFWLPFSSNAETPPFFARPNFLRRRNSNINSFQFSTPLSINLSGPFDTYGDKRGKGGGGESVKGVR